MRYEANYIRNKVLEDGYFLYRNYYKEDEIINFRNELEYKIKNSPIYYSRINNKSIKDYSEFRSHDDVQRTLRHYMYFHNSSSWNKEIKKVIGNSINLRDEIEEDWLKDHNHKKITEKYQNYIILTKYFSGLGKLNFHRDIEIETDFPLLQFNILLSSYGKDYKNGEFILKDKNNKNIAIHKDLDANIGDALIFDKYLLHAVETTEKGSTDIGRWSILIGARAKYMSFFDSYLKKSKFFHFYKNIKRRIK